MSRPVVTELHQAQEKHGSLALTNLSVEFRTDGRHDTLRVQSVIVHHLVGTSHIVVETEVSIDVSDTEMMTQKADKHGLSPCFIHLLLFSK